MRQCNYDFSGTLAVITGASGGIGAGIADAFARAGADTALVYRSNREAAEQTHSRIEGYGGRSRLFRAELEREEEVKRLFEEIRSELGPPQVLINCAGIYPVRSIAETDGRQWEAVRSGNLDSAFYCIREFARSNGAEREGDPAAASPDGSASPPAVVNIASIDAYRPFAGHAHYSAAKSGMLGLSRGAAVEYGARMRVNAVLPGLVGRPGIEEEWPEGVRAYRAAAPRGRIGRAGDIAEACLFLASDAADWITGAELTADGGLSVASGW
jgi:NAD(P)-dependent dehydrogenase (short-subunit alcohol dehydrogenase family)